MFSRRFLVVLVWLLLFSSVEARLVDFWSYEKLTEKSDVVFIVSVVATKAWDEPLEITQFADDLEGRLTTFKIESVLKGTTKKDKIELLHCRLKEGRFPPNGPLLAEFRVKGRNEFGAESPQYLLFLKARPDGRFEPVAGQIDSTVSVRKLSAGD